MIFQMSVRFLYTVNNRSSLRPEPSLIDVLHEWDDGPTVLWNEHNAEKIQLTGLANES